ncbi:MAG: NADH-ubiquinone oxidoreductase-F iron-sulfur binding region domain-containing protein [Ilumatobacteraceae bacterium]
MTDQVPVPNVVHRVLPPAAFATLDAYIAAGGGAGLAAAAAVQPSVVVDELQASGLRGRGGAGFPTATKWRTVMSYESSVLATPVVVNAAEGEPGTFKDRTILRMNPYAVLEGALIAAKVVGSRSVVVATKQRFTQDIARLQDAIAEVVLAGWCNDVEITIVEGPSEYLFGEETALLEVLDGRPPFPRIAPPWRRGSVEVVNDGDAVSPESGLAGDVVMASPAADSVAPPVLVNNVETFANVAAIVARGAAWFRELGTQESPGTIVCTVTGERRRPAVVEVELGTPLRDVLAASTTRLGDVSNVVAVLMGVSNAILTADQLDTPVSYEAMAAIGTGLGSASFIVIDEASDPLAVAAGVSRFLAIESCGQCTPCKQDGMEISTLLAALGRGQGGEHDLDTVQERLQSINDGARCNLATQHQVVVGSILRTFDSGVRTHLDEGSAAVEPMLVAELLAIDGNVAQLDEDFVLKQPDWSTEPVDSGQAPVDRLSEHPL